MIAELQAKTARLVGTHPGSPIRLVPMQQLGVDLVPVVSLQKGITRRLNHGDTSAEKITSQLYNHTPETASKRLDNVRIAMVKTIGRNTMDIIGLALDDATLDSETVAMNAAIDTVAGISPPIGRYRHLNFASVGSEYSHNVQRALSEMIEDMSTTTVSLNPLHIGHAASLLRKAS